MNRTNPIGFIGMGAMGQPMALNLCRAGYALRVYNRTASKTEPLRAQGATVAHTAAAAVTPGGIVITMVTDDAALEAIVRSDGFLEALGSKGVHLSMSTVAPATSQALADLHSQHGSHYVDAPVFGPPPAAATQQLWICVSGPAEAKANVAPLLGAMGQQTFDFGERVGAANLVKLSGNVISFTAAQVMAEVLTVAQTLGLDPLQVVEMLSGTLFPIPIYRYFGKQMAQDPAGLSLGWIGQKDTGLFAAAAADAAVPVPLVERLYEQLRG